MDVLGGLCLIIGGATISTPEGVAAASDVYKGKIVDLLEWEPVVNNKKYDRYTNDLWEYVQQFNHPLNVSK